MQFQPFLHLVLQQLEQEAEPFLLPWHARVRHAMLQVHYGNPRVHYELWLQARTGRAEIGLHFEDDHDRNLLYCAAFAERVLELREALGPEVDLEEWTAVWARLHLTVPMQPLEPPFASELAGHLVRLIAATAGIVRASPAESRRSGSLSRR